MNKLFSLLAPLPKRDLQDFRLFLLSPYFGKSPTLLALFDYIRPFHPTFDSGELESECIFKVLKKDEPYARKFVNDRMSDLKKRLEDYLVVKLIRKNQEEREVLLRKSLLLHDQHQLFFDKIKKEIEILKAKPRRGWKNKLELWDLQNEVLAHPFTSKFNVSDELTTEMMHQLDEAYAILKLRQGIHFLMRQHIFDEIVNIPLLEPIAQQYANSENKLIQLLLGLLEFFKVEQKEIAWERLYQQYLSITDLLPDEEKVDIVTTLNNLAYRIALKRNPDFFDRLHELYDASLKNGVFLRYGKLSAYTFKNIITVAASTGKIEWAEKVISQYQSYLFAEEQATTVYYAKAYLEFYRGNFHIAKDLLDTRKPKELEDKLSFKSLHTRCLYEIRCLDTSYQQILSYELTSYSKFLKNIKLADDRKQSYKNFITMLKALNKGRGKVTKHNASKLKKQLIEKLKEHSSVIAYNWFVQKIETIDIK